MFNIFRKKAQAAKTYARDPGTFQALAFNYGGCLATDRITVEGSNVGYFYKEEPARDLDSGWRFFAGDESDSYLADLTHTAVYDINTIANCDPSITPYLDAPVGSAFIREGEVFVPDEDFQAWEHRARR